MLVRGNRGITRKYSNPEAPRSTRKLLFPAQRHYWWDAYTKATHQQLLQLVTVIQELWIIEEKWRFVPSIRHLKRSDKKLDEDAQRSKKWYRLFLSMSSKVLTQWLTWRRGTLTFLAMYFIIRYKHRGMKRVSTSYYSVCICSTIGKHTLAYSSHEIVFFYCRRALSECASELVCCTVKNFLKRSLAEACRTMHTNAKLLKSVSFITLLHIILSCLLSQLVLFRNS